MGGLLVLAADGLTRTLPAGRGAGSPGSPGPARIATGALPAHTLAAGRVLVAWSPGGLPAGTEAALERMPGVRGATTLVAGVDWLRSSKAPGGTVLDRPARGLGIPLEVALIRPRDYASFVSPAERDLIRGLVAGGALLAETEARMRGAGEGVVLALSDRSVGVSGVVSDAATNGYEALMSGAMPASWTRADRFVLVRLAKAQRRAAVTRRVRALLEPGRVLRVRSQRETTFLRYGDAVHPQMIIKQNFGEFAARPQPDGTLVPDARWTERNILEARVPVLGRVSCHRALFPQLRQALREIVAEGLAYLIDPSQYGGCYGPRFINREPGGRLSHHAWGVGIDLNVSENLFGTRPDQDRRLVQIMEEWGFTWGGRWLIPDGMHFEWSRWP